MKKFFKDYWNLLKVYYGFAIEHWKGIILISTIFGSILGTVLLKKNDDEFIDYNDEIES